MWVILELRNVKLRAYLVGKLKLTFPLGLFMGWTDRVFAQPATNLYKIGWWFFNLQSTHNSNGFVGSDC